MSPCLHDFIVMSLYSYSNIWPPKVISLFLVQPSFKDFSLNFIFLILLKIYPFIRTIHRHVLAMCHKLLHILMAWKHQKSNKIALWVKWLVQQQPG